MRMRVLCNGRMVQFERSYAEVAGNPEHSHSKSGGHNFLLREDYCAGSGRSGSTHGNLVMNSTAATLSPKSATGFGGRLASANQNQTSATVGFRSPTLTPS